MSAHAKVAKAVTHRLHASSQNMNSSVAETERVLCVVFEDQTSLMGPSAQLTRRILACYYDQPASLYIRAVLMQHFHQQF